MICQAHTLDMKPEIRHHWVSHSICLCGTTVQNSLWRHGKVDLQQAPWNYATNTGPWRQFFRKPISPTPYIRHTGFCHERKIDNIKKKKANEMKREMVGQFGLRQSGNGNGEMAPECWHWTSRLWRLRVNWVKFNCFTFKLSVPRIVNWFYRLYHNLKIHILYIMCFIIYFLRHYVNKPTRCTKFLWLDFIFH